MPERRGIAKAGSAADGFYGVVGFAQEAAHFAQASVMYRAKQRAVAQLPEAQIEQRAADVEGLRHICRARPFAGVDLDPV